MNKIAVPQTRVSQKKSWKKIIIENQEQFLGRLNKHEKEMRDEIEKQVLKNFGDKIDMINGALNEIIIQKKIFIEKGLITRKEINKKYEELKKKDG